MRTISDGISGALSSMQSIRGVRYVDNGKVIASAGVQAGMDMALHVVAWLLGEEASGETARYIEYGWQP